MSLPQKALKCNKCINKFNSPSDMLRHDQKKHQDKSFRISPALFSVRSCLMNLMYEITGGMVTLMSKSWSKNDFETHWLVGSLYILDQSMLKYKYGALLGKQRQFVGPEI